MESGEVFALPKFTEDILNTPLWHWNMQSGWSGREKMIKRKKKISHESLCFCCSRYSLARSHAIARLSPIYWFGHRHHLWWGADDHYYLLPFDEVDLYCEKKYGVYLELPQFANGRAEQITTYIRTALMQAGSVEIWDVWLSGYWEFGDRPHICKRTALLTNWPQRT